MTFTKTSTPVKRRARHGGLRAGPRLSKDPRQIVAIKTAPDLEDNSSHTLSRRNALFRVNHECTILTLIHANLGDVE